VYCFFEIQFEKREKNHGNDDILNEYFIEFIPVDDFLSISHVLFNAMFLNGIFPKTLSDALIVPVHKHGDTSIPDNYRGISLLNNLAKLFTSILNKCLIAWENNNEVVTDAQFGFRPGLGTVDAIFANTTFIERKLSKNKRLYFCFVD